MIITIITITCLLKSLQLHVYYNDYELPTLFSIWSQSQITKLNNGLITNFH